MKKIISFLLLTALLASTAACSADTSNADETTAAGTSASDDTTAAETTTAAEYTAPGLDYEGKDFVIAAYTFKNGWRLADDYNEIVAEEENGDAINDAVYTRNRAVEEALNVKLGLFSIPEMSSVSEISTAILAGEDAFKVASQNASGIKSVITNGMLSDIGAIDTLDLEASWWDAKSVEEFSLFGSLYAMTGDFNFYNKGAPITIFFSKKLVEDLNLDNPYQLVRDGKWVIDKMYEMARAAARDLNGNGVMEPEEDCWGFMGAHSTVTQYVRGAGERLTKRGSDGSITVTINTEKTIDIVESFIPFIRDKNVSIFAQDFGGMYKNVHTDLMLARFIDNAALFDTNQLLVALNLRSMEADFGVLPLTKYDESQEEYVGITSNSWITLTTIPVTNDDPDMTGEVLNALGYYSQQYITPAFIDTTVMGKSIRDEDSVEMLELIFSTQTYDIATIYNWGGITTLFSNLTRSSNTNFASEYAKIEEKIASELNDTIAELSK